MNVEHLRSLRDANPFVPFTIHLADGRSHRVVHRDYLSMSPGGRTVIVYHGDEAFSLVDMLLVTEVAVDAPMPPGRTANETAA
jgi:hypothetical protein